MKSANPCARFTGPLLVAVTVACLSMCSGTLIAQTWVSTATQAVGPTLANAISQGNLADSTSVHVNVGLQIQNQAALVSYVQAISDPGNPLYGQELQPSDFLAS